MYLCVPLHGSPNTELLANNIQDLLSLQDAFIMPDDLQKQSQTFKYNACEGWWRETQENTLFL